LTPIQADNWRQFSERMAWESHRWRTERRRRRVVEVVRDLIECFISDNYLDMIGDWDGHPTPSGPGRGTMLYGRNHLEMAYPCDSFDSRLENRGLSHWDERASCVRETDFASAVMCCIRAGFDVAVSPSAGVVGTRYTVGMLRRMFPEGFPHYVDDFFHGPGTSPDAPHLSTLPDGMRVWL
jgi:hypothetical protein